MLGISCRLTHYVSGVLILGKEGPVYSEFSTDCKIGKEFEMILEYISIYNLHCLIMAKVVFNIHNILSFTFTVQYKPVYILLLCMYMYQSLHVMLQD